MWLTRSPPTRARADRSLLKTARASAARRARRAPSDRTASKSIDAPKRCVRVTEEHEKTRGNESGWGQSHICPTRISSLGCRSSCSRNAQPAPTSSSTWSKSFAAGSTSNKLVASLNTYCQERLGYSEDEALKRARVAKLALRFPRALDELRSGAIHLTGLFLLSSHLTEENAEALFAEARGKSRSELERLLAARFPRPDVAPKVQALGATPAGAAASPRPDTPSGPSFQLVLSRDSARLTARASSRCRPSATATNSPRAPSFTPSSSRRGSS